MHKLLDILLESDAILLAILILVILCAGIIMIFHEPNKSNHVIDIIRDVFGLLEMLG